MFSAMRIVRLALRLVRREEGQDLVEYALLASLIAISSVAALSVLGPIVAAFYTSIAGYF